MGWVLPLVAFIVGMVVLAVIVIMKIKFTMALQKMDVRENAPIIHVGNSRRRFTGGYARGPLKSQTPCKNGCTRFEFFPSEYVQQEGKPRPPMQAFVAKDEFIKRQAEGEEGPRNVIRIVDRFPSDIPANLLDTAEGREMAKDGQKAFLRSAFGQWVKAGDEALYEMLLEDSRVGITKKTFAEIKEVNNAVRDGKAAPEATQQPEKKSE